MCYILVQSHAAITRFHNLCFWSLSLCVFHLWDVICRLTNSDHVKSNFIHKVHHICSFGTLISVDFKDIISVVDYKKSEKKGPNQLGTL